MDNNDNNVVKAILKLIKSSEGLTITEIVKKKNLPRSLVRTILAQLEGAHKVYVRKIGMAKVYSGRKK